MKRRYSESRHAGCLALATMVIVFGQQSRLNRDDGDRDVEHERAGQMVGDLSAGEAFPSPIVRSCDMRAVTSVQCACAVFFVFLFFLSMMKRGLLSKRPRA